MAKITVEANKCSRCQKVWVPRKTDTDEESLVCPRCKSPYWNRERLE